MNEITIKLNEEDAGILKELLSASADYANNTPVSNSDVISGLLRFYKKSHIKRISQFVQKGYCHVYCVPDNKQIERNSAWKKRF